MSEDNSSSPFLTLKEAAAFLPGSKDWRYDREELLAWAKSVTPQRSEPKPEPANPHAEKLRNAIQVPRRRNSHYR